MMRNLVGAGVAVVLVAAASLSARAADCPVTYEQLKAALQQSVKPSGGPSNGGLDNNEWAAVVDRTGKVCAIVFSGSKPDDQWLGSRAIAVEKANTANALSLTKFAISTANLYAGAQPAGPLFGLIQTNPPVPEVLYAGDPLNYGSASDPMVGKAPGGVVVFGGGLALYNGRDVVGALGASGDTSCADHNIAWRIRRQLKLDQVPDGPSPNHNDAIIYDIMPDKSSASGFGHPICNGQEAQIAEQIKAGVLPRWKQQSYQQEQERKKVLTGVPPSQK